VKEKMKPQISRRLKRKKKTMRTRLLSERVKLWLSSEVKAGWQQMATTYKTMMMRMRLILKTLMIEGKMKKRTTMRIINRVLFNLGGADQLATKKMEICPVAAVS
jgi:hypothetical protein